MENEEKRKPGRPPGVKNKAVSPFVRVPLSELVKQLAPTAMVPVKRGFAMEILNGEDDDYEDVVEKPTSNEETKLTLLRRSVTNINS
jgi:hypothetical protein